MKASEEECERRVSLKEVLSQIRIQVLALVLNADFWVTCEADDHKSSIFYISSILVGPASHF